MESPYINMPLVSVVIPTHKRPVAYLSRAVESVRSQTYQNIEIIIVDDSTEAFEKRAETERYIRSLNDSRIQYYQNETNLGGALTRNRGIACAKGKYITFLDDDDEYLPRKIEKQTEFMEAGSYDVSLTEMAIYSEKGKLVDYREHKAIQDYSREGLLRYHLMHHLTGTPTFMFRRDKLLEIGGFVDIRIGEEFYLMADAIGRGMKIGYLERCDVKVHQHEGEKLSSGRGKISGENALYAYKKQYFPQLEPAQRRYIRFRHYAVLAISYKRCRSYLKLLGAGLMGFFSAPGVFFREVFGFLTKILNKRKVIRHQ